MVNKKGEKQEPKYQCEICGKKSDPEKSSEKRSIAMHINKAHPERVEKSEKEAKDFIMESQEYVENQIEDFDNTEIVGETISADQYKHFQRSEANSTDVESLNMNREARAKQEGGGRNIPYMKIAGAIAVVLIMLMVFLIGIGGEGGAGGVVDGITGSIP